MSSESEQREPPVLDYRDGRAEAASAAKRSNEIVGKFLLCSSVLCVGILIPAQVIIAIQMGPFEDWEVIPWVTFGSVIFGSIVLFGAFWAKLPIYGTVVRRGLAIWQASFLNIGILLVASLLLPYNIELTIWTLLIAGTLAPAILGLTLGFKSVRA